MQAGDHVEMILSTGTGRIILYNKNNEIIEQWGKIPLPSSSGDGDIEISFGGFAGGGNQEYEYIEPNFIVPNFEEGSYFVIMVGSEGYQHSGGNTS